MIKEFKFRNPKTQNLIVGSFFMLNDARTTPVVVYCHSHGGNQTEGIENIEFLRQQFNCLYFDFSGSGKSEGKYTTLGLGEHLDIGPVMDYIHEIYGVQSFYLWGRSMGAVSILLYLESLIDFDEYSNLKYNIKGVVLDSPFKNSKELVSLSIL